MRREPTTKTYTVIVAPDDTSRVRRFQVNHGLFRRAAVGGAVALVLLLLGLVDYVRLRVQAVDVDRLRAQTQAQQETVDQVSVTLDTLEGELGRLREFERKVRVIANLPTSMAETVSESKENAGQGGGLEPWEGPLPPDGVSYESTLQEPAGDDESASLEPLPQNELDPSALARVTHKADHIGPLLLARTASVEELTDQLQGKSRLLASTPSIWPARGWLTSGYGYRISPFTGQRQFHAGVDIAAGNGTDIVAPARGRVTFVGRKGPLGKALVIDHGYGVHTTYGHTADVYVKPGQEVERGEVVASIGMSGRTTGPHLHYSVEVNGKSRNPLDYVFE
jgi:hypothetical protein